jgi:hypothetical protein
MIYFLAKNFKMIFDKFRSHATEICIFETSFSVAVNDAAGNLQSELNDSNLHRKP